jgi:hypothetical protein
MTQVELEAELLGRDGTELAELRDGIDRLLGSGDPRLVTLGEGAAAAADWVTGAQHWAPILDMRLPHPVPDQVAIALHDVRLVEAGATGMPGGRRSDAGRIFARGVAAVLDWWLQDSRSAPVWADVTASPSVVSAKIIGDVGDDAESFRWRLSAATFPA